MFAVTIPRGECAHHAFLSENNSRIPREFREFFYFFVHVLFIITFIIIEAETEDYSDRIPPVAQV
jgi:hypothetical protein